MKLDLQQREVGGGQVEGALNGNFTFKLPPMHTGEYGLAQVDDYMHRRRGQFPHHPGVSLELEARVSDVEMPGTWGFGFWNDPFSVGFGAGGMRRLLPVLPNAAWFFYGSKHNYLSLREDLPGAGLHAGVFQSPLLPSFFSLLAVPALPFFLWPFSARVLRRAARLLVREDAVPLTIDVTAWHHYHLLWQKDEVEFKIDGRSVFTTSLSPKGRLGLVIWIDNQFFKFTPDGKISFGFLPTKEPQSMDIQRLTLAPDNGYD